MALFLRQSTASQEVPLGYFVDSTDGNTEETALTIANTDIKIWKTGATTLANKNSGGGTHISNGVYYAVLDATDTNTIGPMVLFVHVSGALAVRVECCVLDEAVYDVLFGTTAISTYAGADTSGTTTLLSRLGTPSNLGGGATVAANLADIEAQTDDIGAAGAGLTALATQASVNTIDDFLDTEIAAIKTVTDLLRGIVIASGTIGSTGNSTTTLHLTGQPFGDDELNSYLLVVYDVSATEYHARWVEDWVDATDLATVATLPFTPENAVDTYTVFAIRADVTGGSGLDAAGVRAAIGLAAANLDTQLSTIDDFLDTEVAAILADTNELQTDWVNGGRLDLLIDAIKAKTDNLPAAPAATGDIPTAAAVADAVWDEATVGHTTAGTTGERLTRIPNAAAGGNGGLPTVDAGNLIAGIQGTKNQLDDLNDLSAAAVNAEADTALTDYDPPTRTEATADKDAILAVLPTALTAGGNIKADVIAVSGDTTAADRLEAALDGTVTGSVNDASATTTSFVTDLSSAVNDYYNGRILTFTSGALVGQQTQITDYVGATKTVTVTALTSAPANAVTFVVT